MIAWRDQTEAAPGGTTGANPSQKRRWRVRLRPGIVATFLLVMMPLSVAMVGVLYWRHAELASSLAADAMRRASRDAVISIQGLLDPIARTVSLSATLGRDQRELLRDPEFQRILLNYLEQLPDLYSVYYGFEGQGGFLQAVRLPPDFKSFGPNNSPPPTGARFAIRIIDDADGEPTDRYFYYVQWGQRVGTEQAPSIKYDPRQRPWYRAALAANGVAVSNAYVFSGTNRPGLTLSRQIRRNGALLGVFGADLSSDTLSHILDQSRIGSRGVLFILDRDGRLVGYPDPEKTIVRNNDQLEVAFADAVADPLVAGAVRRYSGGSADFQAKLDEAGDAYLVSFTPVGGLLGDTWTVGVIADSDEFVAPLRRASFFILAIGGLFLLLACIGITWASRLLTRPIAGLIAETAQIRRLELDAPSEVKSNLAEIDSLADAMAATKAALRSFGRYVPRELVREIVEHGNDAELGGRRRSVTILFTDLADFTKATETLDPEEVLDTLSRYFEVMTRQIHEYRGTIDKFIGDAVMGLWNAPSDDPDHAANACLAALSCRATAEDLNGEMRRQHLPPLYTRFGIHTGAAVVGNVGSSERMQYTALGATVNLASRVEGLNKRFGTEILVTEAVEAQVKDRFALRPLGTVLAAGTTLPTAMFELVGMLDAAASFPMSTRDRRRMQDWLEAYAAYLDRRWSRAGDGFRAFLAAYGDDTAGRLLLAQCESFITAPPAAGEESLLVFNEK